DAVRVLQSHSWPGNVRELKNVIDRSAVLASGDALHAGDIQLDRREKAPVFAASSSPQSLEAVEKRTIEEALQSTRGHREKAANILGISTKTLREKIRR